MSELFDRAKRIGLLYVTQWLPNGKREGNEWVAINPTRNDNKTGSFKINLATGKWMDGSTGDKGGDAVSMYAYLNESRLSQLASEKGYKNIQKGLQVEAAKEILTTYDIGYSPSENDNFEPTKKSKGNYWESFSRYFPKKGEELPKFEYSFYEKNWGDFNQYWDFFYQGKFIVKIARFIDDSIPDKKNKTDCPFTLWTDGKIIKWRAKRIEGKYPLWNVDELSERQNEKVALWEGQKDASLGKKYIKNFVSVGWYQGAGNTNQTDWEPLRGREVWFIFDADIAGRKSIGRMKKIANDYDLILHIVYPPVNAEKGWSLADDLPMDEEEFEKRLNEKSKKTNEKYVDDENPFEFKILGYSGEYITFYPYGSKHVVKHKATNLGKATLVTLMDRSIWGEYYAKEDGGIAWDSATNDILRAAESTKVFDPTIVRGSGAWIDEGKLVVNTGEHLIIDCKKNELFDYTNNFVYERGQTMPYDVKNIASLDDMKIVSDIITRIKWEDKIHAEFLKGWILLAPLGGALRWRSHIWITGRKGSGKSWILENILYPLVGTEFGIMAYGSSTAAGIRNALRNTSKATIMDEMESDNTKYQENIEQILKMYREGSSGIGQGAITFHGTSDGEGRQWIVQSMACFASIGAAIKHGADRSRFTILPLDIERNPKKREEIFSSLCEKAKFITRFLGRSIVARTLSKFDDVSRSIDIMISQMVNIVGNRREADQLGTLLGGAWMFNNDTPPTAATANEYLIKNEIDSLKSTTKEKTDEELCLSEILNSKIEISDGSHRFKVNISAAIEYWYYNKQVFVSEISTDFQIKDLSLIKNELSQIGIKMIDRQGDVFVRFACSHPAIRKLLTGTPWMFIYDDMLTRLDCFVIKKGPDRFSGVAFNFVELKASLMFDDAPF